jgi:ribonuclease HI
MIVHVTSLNLRKIQIFGDSKSVVEWEKGKNQMHVLRARNLMEQIKSFLSSMEWFSISHIPISLNTQADELSKEALELDKGTFIVQEFYDGNLLEEMIFCL